MVGILTLVSCSPERAQKRQKIEKKATSAIAPPPKPVSREEIKDHTVYAPITPTVAKEQYEALPEAERQIGKGENQALLGQLTVFEPRISFVEATQTVGLTGRAVIKGREFTFSLYGRVGEDGSARMQPTSEPQGIQVRARAVCLNYIATEQRFDCASSFIDLYVKMDNVTYTEQFEGTAPVNKKSTPQAPTTPPPAAAEDSSSDPNEVHDGHPEPDLPAGRFSGFQGDVNDLFEEPPLDKVPEVEPPKAPAKPKTNPRQGTPKPPKPQPPRVVEATKPPASPKAAEPRAELRPKPRPKSTAAKAPAPTPAAPPTATPAPIPTPTARPSVPVTPPSVAPAVQAPPARATPADADDDDDRPEPKQEVEQPDEVGLRPMPRPRDLKPVVASNTPMNFNIDWGQIVAPKFDGPPANQAFCFAHYDKKNLDRTCDYGRLANPTPLDLDSPHFQVMSKPTGKYFGTRVLVSILEQIGRFVYNMLDGYRLQINSLSDADGGKQRGGHASHQNGMDADISFIVSRDLPQLNHVTSGGRLKPAFMMAAQWNLWKALTKTELVSYIFVSPVIKRATCAHARSTGDIDTALGRETLRRLYNESNHTDHWHLRLKCTGDNPRCRDNGDPVGIRC